MYSADAGPAVSKDLFPMLPWGDNIVSLNGLIDITHTHTHTHTHTQVKSLVDHFWYLSYLIDYEIC